MPSVPLALGPIRWPNSSKAGALSLNVYESVGYLNEIVIVIVIDSDPLMRLEYRDVPNSRPRAIILNIMNPPSWRC
jgi:hypothetical protein